MSTYLGYYRPTMTYREASENRARQGDRGPEPQFVQMVVDLPLKLPSGCTIVGSYAPAGAAVTNPPSVMIVETHDTAHLTFIQNYYTGYLEFQWCPATAVGGNKNEREAWRQTTAAAPEGVR